MKTRWKITLGIIAGLAVVLIIILISPMGRFIITGGLANLEEQSFNADQWMAVEHAEPIDMRIRLMMLEDLMENQLKTGMDSSAVKEMLGEPDRKYGFSYGLGMLTEGIEPFYLVIKYDTTGKVSKLEVESENKLQIKVK